MCCGSAPGLVRYISTRTASPPIQHLCSMTTYAPPKICYAAPPNDMLYSARTPAPRNHVKTPPVAAVAKPFLSLPRSNTLPLPKNTPPSTPVRQNQRPPNPPLPNFNDRLPVTAHLYDTILISLCLHRANPTNPVLRFSFPRHPQYLPTWTLNSQFRGLLSVRLPSLAGAATGGVIAARGAGVAVRRS